MKKHLQQPIQKPKPYYPKGHVGDSSDFIRPLFFAVIAILFVVAVIALNAH